MSALEDLHRERDELARINKRLREAAELGREYVLEIIARDNESGLKTDLDTYYLAQIDAVLKEGEGGEQ